MRIVYILLTVFALYGSAFADPLSDMSTVSGVTPQQAGADRVSLSVTGGRLPRPEIDDSDPGKIEIFFRNTVMAASRWEKEYPFPLLSKVEMEHVKDGLKMTLTTGDRLMVRGVKGEGGSNRMTFDLRTWTSAQRAESERVMAAPKTPPVDQSDPFQTDKKITIDFRYVAIQDVFRMLGDIMNLNVVLDPSMSEVPPLTMKFEDAPLKEVFGYLMRLYRFTYAKVGRTLIIGAPESISRAMGDEKTRAFQVAYSDVKAMPDILQGLTTIPKENILVDERLRRLFVQGSENQLAQFERVLQRIDHPGQQVMLRARIVEIKDDATDELETMLNAVYKNWWLSTSSSGAKGGYSYINDPNTYTPPTGDNRPGGIDFPGVAIPEIGRGAVKLLDTGLRALVTSNKGKVLANPSVITISGQKASIKLVENLKYISARDEAGNPTYSDEEVGPKLEFTPVIGRDGIISVELSISTGEVVSWKEGNQGEKVPQTSKREVVTSVRVRDGEPFVVGGLFNERNSVNTTKIPILGDIPLLGELFKSKTKISDRTEVVMVVIPYILDVEDAPIDSWDM
nr:secretion protein [uncultured Dethiosulfovibrio sp.]